MDQLIASADFRDIAPRALQVLRSANPRTDAVVFDIDATVLYNNPDTMCRADFNNKIKMLYDVAHERKIPVYFVTARVGTHSNFVSTLKQLHCMGYTTWYAGLFMRPPAVTTEAAIGVYKLDARKAIMQNYKRRIILNVGDQWTDVMAGTPLELHTLRQKYDTQHVFFKSPPRFAAEYALKLYELRD